MLLNTCISASAFTRFVYFHRDTIDDDDDGTFYDTEFLLTVASFVDIKEYAPRFRTTYTLAPQFFPLYTQSNNEVIYSKMLYTVYAVGCHRCGWSKKMFLAITPYVHALR